MFLRSSKLVVHAEYSIIEYHQNNVFNFSLAYYAQKAYVRTINSSRSRCENQLEIWLRQNLVDQVTATPLSVGPHTHTIDHTCPFCKLASKAICEI